VVVLCWFHHQVVEHERQFEIVFPVGDRRRIRFNPPEVKRRTTLGQPHVPIEPGSHLASLITLTPPKRSSYLA